MPEILTTVAAVLIGGVVLVVALRIWHSGILHLLFALLVFGVVAYIIGYMILDAVSS